MEEVTSAFANMKCAKKATGRQTKLKTLPSGEQIELIDPPKFYPKATQKLFKQIQHEVFLGLQAGYFKGPEADKTFDNLVEQALDDALKGRKVKDKNPAELNQLPEVPEETPATAVTVLREDTPPVIDFTEDCWETISSDSSDGDIVYEPCGANDPGALKTSEVPSGHVVAIPIESDDNRTDINISSAESEGIYDSFKVKESLIELTAAVTAQAECDMKISKLLEERAQAQQNMAASLSKFAKEVHQTTDRYTTNRLMEKLTSTLIGEQLLPMRYRTDVKTEIKPEVKPEVSIKTEVTETAENCTISPETPEVSSETAAIVIEPKTAAVTNEPENTAAIVIMPIPSPAQATLTGTGSTAALAGTGSPPEQQTPPKTKKKMGRPVGVNKRELKPIPDTPQHLKRPKVENPNELSAKERIEEVMRANKLASVKYRLYDEQYGEAPPKTKFFKALGTSWYACRYHLGVKRTKKASRSKKKRAKVEVSSTSSTFEEFEADDESSEAEQQTS